MFYRRREGTDRQLSWKVRAFFAGAVLGLVGIRLENPWLVGVAVAVLVLGFLLRFFDVESDEQRETPSDRSEGGTG